VNNIKISFMVIFCLLVSGCASMLNGDQQNLTIKTHAQAEIFINDRYVGTGTATRAVARDQAHDIRVELGQCSQSFTTQARFNYTSLLGLVMDAGLISLPTDFITGAAWEVYPDKIKMQPSCEKPS
jgi:uncharacterized protein YceK